MPARRSTDNDERYVIDLCDEVLGQVASRQHCFDFLRGDPDVRGMARRLPVDAFYAPLKLAAEFHEQQHSKPVPHFDKRMTVSGVPRSEQRRRYDQRRRDTLPAWGITLVELSYDQFPHRANRQLKRSLEEDRAVVRRKLAAYIPARG